MKYTEQTLSTGESIVYQGKVDWFIFITPIIMILIGIYFYTNTTSFTDSSNPVGVAITYILTILFLLIGTLRLINEFIYKISTELVITSKRIVFKTGLIRRSTVELNFKQVESLSFNQSILGRIFNFGNVYIYGTGGITTPIHSIDSPLIFRNKAIELIDSIEK